MKIRIKITKRMLLQLAVFIALAGAAMLFDSYFENNPEVLKDIKAESTNSPSTHAGMFFISQVNNIDIKTPASKDTADKLKIKSHDKLLRKFHQLRNFQVLKAEVETQTTPLILSYHYLIFRNYFFTVDNDEPLIS